MSERLIAALAAEVHHQRARVAYWRDRFYKANRSAQLWRHRAQAAARKRRP